MAKSEQVLLALEDSPTLALMDRALHAVRYGTAIAKDTTSLAQILQETTPALVMVGEKFNGHNGLDIASELLERFPTLPILIYSEKETPELIKGVFRIGLRGYLCPPLKTDDIVEAVRNSLKHAHRLGDWLRYEVKRTTASLKQRAEMSESERARLEAVFNSIQDGVVILDIDNYVLFINPAMCRAFGVDADMVVGKSILDAIPHPDLRALITHTENDPLQYYEITFPDGRVANAQFNPIRGVGTAITMQDITYLKEIDHIKSDFVHTVSHDLRSPLTSVIGYTELVERAGSLNDSQRDFLKRIQESVQHITSLINDLLDLGRVEAGFDSRREYVQLEGILRYTLDMLQGQVKNKQLKIQTEIAPSLPPLRANPIRLRQVLDNIIGNAIKYTPKGGNVRISITSEDHQIIVQVTDSGPGILPEDQPHIFDKFYRGGNVSSKTEGSGLGLAIVKSIVDAHQGRIWVESVVGKGSSFFVVLPVSQLETKPA